MYAITGLIIRNNTIEWTRLNEDKTGSIQQVSKTVALDINNAEEPDPDNIAAAIQRQCPELNGPVTIGISSDQTLMRVVDLPTVDTNELQSMVQLQVDTLSPFPEDKTVSSFEVLSVKNTSSRVLIAVVRRAVVESAGNICKKAGLDVLRIDIEAMGWWRLLKDNNAALNTGRQVIIMLTAENGIVIALENGEPLLFKSINGAADLAEEEYASEIAGETRSLILALDMEHGETPIERMDFWCADTTPKKIIEHLRDNFEQDIQMQSLASMPYLTEGLAKRVINPRFSIKTSRGIQSVIDLIPEAWRIEAEYTLLKQRIITAAAVILGVWFIGLLLVGVGHYWNLNRLRKVETRMATIQGPADEVRALQRNVISFEQYMDSKRSALECLHEISSMLPDDVTLTSFQFRKGQNVVVRGESLKVDSIIDFKQQLDNSILFETIEMGAIQPRKRIDQTVQTFHMDARIPEQSL